MFLNYFLDPELKAWTCVDVTGISASIEQSVASAKSDKRIIMRWDRSLMGVRSSPYNCVQTYLINDRDY
jgi:hypothetical protein